MALPVGACQSGRHMWQLMTSASMPFGMAAWAALEVISTSSSCKRGTWDCVWLRDCVKLTAASSLIASPWRGSCASSCPPGVPRRSSARQEQKASQCPNASQLGNGFLLTRPWQQQRGETASAAIDVATSSVAG